VQALKGAQEALEKWRLYGDALPWARWLADLRNELDDPNGWSNAYHTFAIAELAGSGLTTQDINELARESRPLLASLLNHTPWPVPSLWWRDQIRSGKRDGAHHVAMMEALGADNERPNGTRQVATALSIVQHIHEVNSVYYTDHDVPMDAAAVTGTHIIRELLHDLQAIAKQDADLSTDLLRSVGETVEIRESILEENHRLREELADMRARIDNMQVQILDAYSAGAEDRAPDEDG